MQCWAGDTPASFTSGKGWPERGAKGKLHLLQVCQGTALFAPNSTQARKTYFCPVPLEYMQLIGNLSGLAGLVKVRMERKGWIQERL